MKIVKRFHFHHTKAIAHRQSTIFDEFLRDAYPWKNECYQCNDHYRYCSLGILKIERSDNRHYRSKLIQNCTLTVGYSFGMLKI